MRQDIFIISSMSRVLSTKVFVIAIASILVVGLVSILALDRFINPPSSNSLSSLLPMLRAPSFVSLDLSQPDDQVVVFDQNLLISGKTSDFASVIISVEDTDTQTLADQDGNFSKQVGLADGLNHITITSFDSSGNSKQATRTIFYSQEKL